MAWGAAVGGWAAASLLGSHLAHLDVLLLAADLEDLPDLLLRVRHRRDDEQPVEQVDRDAVRRLVVCAADARDAAVGSDGEHGGEVGLERAVEVGEALHVEHVHLSQPEQPVKSGH